MMKKAMVMTAIVVFLSVAGNVQAYEPMVVQDYQVKKYCCVGKEIVMRMAEDCLREDGYKVDVINTDTGVLVAKKAIPMGNLWDTLLYGSTTKTVEATIQFIPDDFGVEVRINLFVCKGNRYDGPFDEEMVTEAGEYTALFRGIYHGLINMVLFIDETRS